MADGAVRSGDHPGTAVSVAMDEMGELGLAFDYQAEVGRACGGWPIGRGEKVEAMSDYDKEVGEKLNEAKEGMEGKIADRSVREGFKADMDAAINKRMNPPPPSPVGKPFPIVSGDGKFYDTE